MISDNLLFKSIQFAYDKHEGQVDKQGVPYFLHPLRVCLKMEDNDSRAIAILHDVLEDTNTTVDDLSRLGLSLDIISDICVLSKLDNKPYIEYIRRINNVGGRAKKIKLADIHDNFSRISTLSDENTAARLHKKYSEALEILEGRNDSKE